MKWFLNLFLIFFFLYKVVTDKLYKALQLIDEWFIKLFIVC